MKRSTRLDRTTGLKAREVPLAALALVAAASSILALILHALGWLRMPYAVSFLTVPGLALLLMLMAYAGRGDYQVLRNRLLVGSVAGLVGLIPYDLGRLLLILLVPLSFDPFAPIAGFGTFITGQPPDAPISLVAGWAYHISNGWTFGVAYALIFGPARWWWGLIWGLVLEIGMILVYPVIFSGLRVGPFLLVSIIGHAVFGATLGAWCRRYAIRGG